MFRYSTYRGPTHDPWIPRCRGASWYLDHPGTYSKCSTWDIRWCCRIDWSGDLRGGETTSAAGWVLMPSLLKQRSRRREWKSNAADMANQTTRTMNHMEGHLRSKRCTLAAGAIVGRYRSGIKGFCFWRCRSGWAIPVDSCGDIAEVAPCGSDQLQWWLWVWK